MDGNLKSNCSQLDIAYHKSNPEYMEGKSKRDMLYNTAVVPSDMLMEQIDMESFRKHHFMEAVNNEGKEVSTKEELGDDLTPSDLNNTQMIENCLTIDYSTDLFHSSSSVFSKADKGLQTCKALATYLQERASIEENYGKGLAKIFKIPEPDEWALTLRNCWKTIRKGYNEQGNIHRNYASKLSSTIGAAMNAFAHQQEIQINQLTREGQNLQKQLKVFKSMHSKVKQKYQKHCDDAETAINNLKHSLEDNVEPQDKTSLGATQIFSKVWDTTGFLAKPSVEKLRLRVDSALEDVMSSKKEYEDSILLFNTQREKFVKQKRENLHAFQLTEEQRIGYIKDILLRFDEINRGLIKLDEEIIAMFRESVWSFDTAADAQDCFPSLSLNGEKQEQNNKAIDGIMEKAALFADEGRKTTQFICNSLVESINVEETYAKCLNRLLSMQSGPFISLESEGTSLNKAWGALLHQTDRVYKNHMELAVLTAEPFCLNLVTMKEQHDATRKSLVASHNSLRRELTAHYAIESKAQQRLEDKCRDLQAGMASLSQAKKERPNGVVESDSSVAPPSRPQFGLVNAINPKVSKLEQKVLQLTDERKELENTCALLFERRLEFEKKHLAESIRTNEALQKNEEFRLQVLKISFEGLLRAYDTTLQEAKSTSDNMSMAIEGIHLNNDIQEFIAKNRSPFTTMRTIQMDIPLSPLLKSALSQKYGQVEEQLMMSVTTPLSSIASPAIGVRQMDKSGVEDNLLENEDAGESKSENIPISPLSLSDAAEDPNFTSFCEMEDPPSPFSSGMNGTTEVSLDGLFADSTLSNNEEILENSISSSLEGTNDSSLRRRRSLAVDRQQSASDSLILPKEDDHRRDLVETSDFQRRFNLPPKEQLVISFSCAYYQSNFPAHGRLYLSQNYLCFAGWRETQLILPIGNITSVEKKYTALVVPNAIEIVTDNDTKYFFASFLYREDCYSNILQLREISKKMEEILHTSSNSSNDAPLLPPDTASVAGYNVIYGTTYCIKVSEVFALLWETESVYEDFLRSEGENDLSISSWVEGDLEYTAINTKENFNQMRNISFNHNKKYIIGPSSVPTRQTQRVSIQDDVVIIHSTSNVMDVPFHDYFRVETRYVFSKASHSVCHMQIGVHVCFVKSAWLKKQIEGSTITEAKSSAIHWDAYLRKQFPQLAATSMPSSSLNDANANQGSSANSTDDEKMKKTFLRLVWSKWLSTVMSFEWYTCVQVVLIIVAFSFLIMLHRICKSLEELQDISSAALDQQRQQLERLHSIVEKLGTKS